MIPNCKNWSDTCEFTKCVFPFIFFIFYTLFCLLSQNKLGWQDVPFVALGHICKFMLIFDPSQERQ